MRSFDSAHFVMKLSRMLLATCVAGLVAGCADEPGPGAEDESGTADGPMPPDLGPEATVCGERDDWLASDEEFAVLDGCEIYEGSLLLTRSTDRSSLSSLRIVRRSISAGTTSKLVTLDGLDSLEWVGSFHFSDTGTEDLSALGNLTGVGDYFELIALQDLESLQGLERLRTVGELKLEGNPLLASLDGLSGLESTEGDLNISYNESLTSLAGLSALKQVGGNVTIRQNAQLSPNDRDAFLDRIEIGGVVNLD